MLCNITTRIKSLALGNACKVHFRKKKYSHKNYDQVMMQKNFSFLISEIPRIFFLNINAQCIGFLPSLTGESGEEEFTLLNKETKQI